ncbi:MAG: glycosyl hydrolase family 28 protein [Candidatus Methylacidiphilales bacterium]|nr:glycosyl hydrolase family 28 protein [Candidatus Methylacidiphilales bacterium]
MIVITEYGAVAGIATAQTRSIQSAIDACAATGGGTVLVPAGIYHTGTLQLKDRVTLHLENGACLKGSADLVDYPEIEGSFTDAVGQKRNRCLLYAVGATGVGLSGQGTIDGNGGAFGYEEDGRPFLLRFVDCRDVQVTGITLRDSPGWVSHYLGCENVLVQGITIHSHTNGNNDGIDIDSCRRFRISACDLDCGDDAICIKSTRATPSENIVVTGCVIRSVWGALKLGTESAGDFRNIIISDCVIRDTHGGGLKIISMDGSRLENVQINNIIMDNVSGPIFIRLGSRMRRYHADQPERPVGILRNVSIRNVSGSVWEEGYPLYGKLKRKAGIIITGIPGHCIEGLEMENIRFDFPGGGSAADAAAVVEEQETAYPEFPSFHPLPAWGLYLRHVRDLRFRNIRLDLRGDDQRPPCVAEDASDLHWEDIRIQGRSMASDKEFLTLR